MARAGVRRRPLTRSRRFFDGYPGFAARKIFLLAADDLSRTIFPGFAFRHYIDNLIEIAPQVLGADRPQHVEPFPEQSDIDHRLLARPG